MVEKIVSPGISISVEDVGTFSSGGNGTVPFVIINTAQDKTSFDDRNSNDVAEYTTKKNAGKVVSVTSQRDLIQKFGTPLFYGNGDERNEYGLLALHSYLGASSRAIVMRSDVDLGALSPIKNTPSSYKEGVFWLNNENTNITNIYVGTSADDIKSITKTFYVDSLSELDKLTDGGYARGSASDESGDITLYYAVLVKDNNKLFFNVTEAIYDANVGTPKTINILTYTPSTNLMPPTAIVTGEYWVNFRNVNIDIQRTDSSLEFKSLPIQSVIYGDGTKNIAKTGLIVDSEGMPLYFNDEDIDSNEIQIRLVDNKIEIMLGKNDISSDINNIKPDKSMIEGTLWFNDTKNELSVYQFDNSKNTDKWGTPINISYGNGDPNNDTPYLVYVDLNASEEDYPSIYKKDGANWSKIDKTDQSSSDGILFINTAPTSNTPAMDGMLCIDMSASKNTVKQYINGVPKNVVSNNVDGSGVFGRLAQRKYIYQAMKSAIINNDELKDESVEFSLMCAVGYPELARTLLELNIARNETSFIILDTPMRKNPTEIIQWINNTNAAEDGESGLTTKSPHHAVYYPSCVRTTDLDGESVTTFASHALLYSYAYSDSVSYPWFAVAGTTRGRIQNASSIGYLDTTENEFRVTPINQGQRDDLYYANINPITVYPRDGTVIWGQKTLGDEGTYGSLDRINVARLVAYLRERMDAIGKRFVFSQNDTLTRERVRNTYGSFLTDIVSNRGIEDFVIVCDETNNTPIRVNRHELWVDIAIEPTEVAEFIYIPVRLI